MMADDVAELACVIEPHDHHERARELRMPSAGGVFRRLTQVEMEGKQRRQQVVLEGLDLIANVSRHQRFVEQIEEGLMGIERDTTKWRARMKSPSAVSIPMARPFSTTMRRGSVIRRNSPPVSCTQIPARGPGQQCRHATSALSPGSREAPQCDDRSRGREGRPRVGR